MKRGFVMVLLCVYVTSTVLFCDMKFQEGSGFFNGALGYSGRGGKLSSSELGALCISSAYPELEFEVADSRDNEAQGEQAGGADQNPTSADTSGAADGKDENRKAQAAGEVAGKDSSSSKKGNGKDSTKVVTSKSSDTETVIFGKDPAVLIVHTHATESYLPSSGGNYHKKAKENTVRDVGDVLAEALEEEGIGVVHDQTLHDDPSYNLSYNRSYETTEKLLKKYPSIVCVIDLHRDAIAAEVPAATVAVNGKTCAKYSYVVSNAVETYQKNLKFIRAMNENASKDYSGFTGKVLERGYRYNQGLSSKYMLLEIGYNRNDITECRNTAAIVGKVLAKTLKQGA